MTHPVTLWQIIMLHHIHGTEQKQHRMWKSYSPALAAAACGLSLLVTSQAAPGQSATTDVQYIRDAAPAVSRDSAWALSLRTMIMF